MANKSTRKSRDFIGRGISFSPGMLKWAEREAKNMDLNLSAYMMWVLENVKAQKDGVING